MKSILTGILLTVLSAGAGEIICAAQPGAASELHTITAGKVSMTVDAARGAKISSFCYEGRNILSQTKMPNSWGSTFWTSPQTDWNWPPVAEFDRLPYTVEEKEHSTVMTGAVNSGLGFRVIKEFSAEGNVIVVTYTIENASDRERKAAPWEITRVPGEGLIFFDAPMESIVPPATTAFTDKIPFRRKYGAAWYEVDSFGKPRKVNADGSGWMAYLNDGLLFVKEFENIQASEAAPAEAEIQVYVNSGKTYIELENQGRYVTLRPGESISYKVRWHLVPFDGDAAPSKKLLGTAGSLCAMDSATAAPRAPEAESGKPDPDFFIYLCIGQSNMEAGARPEEQDKAPVDPRFQFMAAVDMPSLGRVRNQWYPADSPICRQETGLGPVDFFGRTMVANLPEKYRVGVINVSVAGAKMEIFGEGYQEYIDTSADWLKNIAAQYGGCPYLRLIETAREAQKYGVIKGLLIHQGESNNGDPEWPAKVKKIYDSMVSDLGLDPKEFYVLSGELKYKEQNGTCYDFNTDVLPHLPETLPNSYVISAKGCAGSPDPWHFSVAGFRELGKRYAMKALELQNFPYSGEGEVYAPDAVKKEGGPTAFGRTGRTGREGFKSTLFIPGTDDVVFLYRGPQASSVLLSSQFLKESVPMEKGPEGVWFTKQTIPDRDIYPYNFIVDGVSVSDPACTELFPNEGFKASLLEMPDSTALYTVRKDVPHGKVTHVTYWSHVMNESRRFLVYTPAGYGTSGRSYPVFYLISGTTDTEETWYKVGKADVIADNLAAQGLAEEMIIVMPYGNMGMTPMPASFEASEMYAKFGRELTECIMPVVEREYRTLPGPENRAIAGFSRGGGQSLFTAYSHPELFSWVCSYSAYLTPEVMDHFFTNISWAPLEFESQYRLFWFGVGSEDFLFNDVTRHREYFDSKGIHYQYLQTTGGHTWMNARTYLATTLQLLFK